MEKKQASGEDTTAFYIIGIGASAGGLDSFEKFFTHIPSDSGMAFVLFQHIAPDHKSMLPDLLKKFTSMEVYEVKDSMKVRPNCIYINPPGNDVGVINGALHLLEPTHPRGMKMPINHFLRSLAQDRQEKAIGIIFSGTGTDGTLGLQAVKEKGGLTMVQEPGSAEYDGMPLSVVKTGMADYIMSPDKMPEKLIELNRCISVRKLEKASRF
ncbi:MAG: chemotaxis protein CheB, partial [bacterium]|nr:chemotaxis protein CheB [bacterium]